MSVTVDKDCVTMDDGTMFCWDRDDKCCYALHKKKVGIREMPEEAVVRLLELVQGQNRGAE
jgi:hypothetical protein